MSPLSFSSLPFPPFFTFFPLSFHLSTYISPFSLSISLIHSLSLHPISSLSLPPYLSLFMELSQWQGTRTRENINYKFQEDNRRKVIPIARALSRGYRFPCNEVNNRFECHKRGGSIEGERRDIEIGVSIAVFS